MPGPGSSGRRRFLTPLLALAFLAGVTELPYANGRRSARAGHHYDGLIAHSDDLHAYLSFARQSSEGRLLFENRYAPEAHRPVFFNLEWLVVGWAMRWLGDPAVLTAWRLAGLALLVFGFWTLSGVLPRYEARLIALVLFGLGGGFGWVAELVRTLAPTESMNPVPSPSMDMGGFGLHPFVQMLQNPHFATAHGLVLLALAFLVRGERTGQTSAYALAGAMALLACLSRPYELLAFTLVVPTLHLVSPSILDRRRLGQRALVLLILAPAWLPVWVIWTAPSYRPLAQQGQMPVVSFSAHLLALGVCVVLITARVVRDRGLPLRTAEDRLLLIWGATIFLLVHANRFTAALAYSPQLMITSMGPLVLLAVPVIAGDDRPRSARPWLPVAILALALPSSAIVLAKRFRDAATPYFRFSEGERQAWEWLAAKAQPSDLLLATAESGNRLPRHVSAHVFAGHWTLTPDYARRTAEADAFFQGRLAPEEAAAFIRSWRIDWIWVGPAERSMAGWSRPGFAPGCDEAYRLGGVRILRCPRAREHFE